MASRRSATARWRRSRCCSTSLGFRWSQACCCASAEPYLDAHPGERGDNLGYAAFGQVVSGMAVVARILSLPTNGETKYKDQRGQWLKPPVTIRNMRRVT